MSRCPTPSVWNELDAQPRAARLALLAHVRACAACRERMLRTDPTHAFALLALRPVPQAALERVSVAVAATIDAGRAADLPRARRAVIAAWSGAAAAVLLAVAVAGMLAGSAPVPGPADDPSDMAFALAPPAAPRAGVEVLSSPGATRVVDLAVGDTQVVMIFDERLDL